MRHGLLVAIVLALGHVAAVGQDGADGFREAAAGVEYRHERREAGPLSIHVLRVNRSPQRWDVRCGLGQDAIYGLEPLDGIVRRVAEVVGQPAVAAINGDFFVIKVDPYQGDPCGLQIVDGELASAAGGNSLWVTRDGELHVDAVASRLCVLWPNGEPPTPCGLNEARRDEAAVLYTARLGLRPGAAPAAAPGTRTRGGREFVLQRAEGQPWLPLTVGTTYTARVREVREAGDTPLIADHLILSVGPALAGGLPPIHVGDCLRLAVATEPDLRGVQTAIGTGRILRRDGQVQDLGPANQPRHPRSMIGWNRDHLLLFVIDGRQPVLSIGMTYPEMAALAESYGCRTAVELDGGGSSTLWLTGRILNSPSDGRPRAIANGLMLFPVP